MSAPREPKTKPCFKCQQPTAAAYRVRHAAGKAWVFVCPDCLLDVKVGNSHYTYGGTWKGSRH